MMWMRDGIGDVGITQSKISSRQLELGDVCASVVWECANYSWQLVFFPPTFMHIHITHWLTGTLAEKSKRR